jgi:hypothetical protein
LGRAVQLPVGRCARCQQRNHAELSAVAPLPSRERGRCGPHFGDEELGVALNRRRLDSATKLALGNVNRAVMACVWPLNWAVAAPVDGSHIRIVESKEPDASLPSGSVASVVTEPS